MRWTVREIRYLEAHASDGAAAIARELGRSIESVRHQAYRYGLSLRRSWLCPRCGQRTFNPLSGKTGWCAACTREAQAAAVAAEVAEMEAEKARLRAAGRERQRMYSRKSRLKKMRKSGD